jgi:ATP-dependent RNA helicase DDX27
MPMTYKNYIHRVGRTARAQNNGRSVSLVAESDRWLLKEIIKSSNEPVKSRIIPPDVIEYYKSRCKEINQEVVRLLSREKEEKIIKSMENKVKYLSSYLLNSTFMKF